MDQDYLSALGQIQSGISKAALRNGAVAARSLELEAARLTSDAPATGQPPQPGPVPPQQDAAPIRWSFPYAVNQALTPRREDRRLTPFEQLRALADVFDLVRIAIEIRKDQITGLEWDFAKIEKSEDAQEKNDPQVNALRTFFRKPDKVHNFDTWLRLVIEEILVVDALSIYRRPTRGGGLYALEVIDGTTVKPLLNERGFTPLPPAVAYRQIINGQPVQGGDCTIDQLLYRPRTVRTWTPYGLSPTECVLLTISTALNRQIFNLQYYAEGNVPEGVMSAPEGWTPEQIAAAQQHFDDLLAGNAGARRRLRIVGPKMAESVYQFKQSDFDTKFDEWLLKVVASAFGVPPSEMGFTQDSNRAIAKAEENVAYRRGIRPLSSFIKAILDEIIAIDLQMPGYHAIVKGGEPEDRLVQAQIDRIEIDLGVTSVDEVRARKGQKMIGLGPTVRTNEGPVFVEQLIKRKDEDPTTSDPAAAAARPAEDLSTPNTDLIDPDQAKEPPDPEPSEKAQAPLGLASELKTFRTFALRRAKAGKTLKADSFESAVIPEGLRHAIVDRIAEASGGSVPTVDAVRQVFESVSALEEEGAVEKGAARQKATAQTRYRKAMKSYFRDLSEDLGDHLASSIAASVFRSAEEEPVTAKAATTQAAATPQVINVHLPSPEPRPTVIVRTIERDPVTGAPARIIETAGDAV